ncbi:hypothetical protein FOL46_004322 [Perkinsus olseni]|uniref:Uncharacterized protein n=1 Tax=Perkinsus olseni TaxID=32597 RepID=A0A7J6LZP0_PEROL|nr:hypothetical protein FOL46_004322 [Perkinsus olseni]
MRTRATITSLLLGTPCALQSLQAHSEPDFPKKWLKGSWRIDARPESDVCGVLPATSRSFDSEIYFRLKEKKGRGYISMLKLQCGSKDIPEEDTPLYIISWDRESAVMNSFFLSNPTTSTVIKDDKEFNDPIGEMSFALESYEDEKMCAEAAAHLMKALGGTFVEASNAYDILLEKLCFRYNSVKA